MFTFKTYQMNDYDYEQTKKRNDEMCQHFSYWVNDQGMGVRTNWNFRSFSISCKNCNSVLNEAKWRLFTVYTRIKPKLDQSFIKTIELMVIHYNILLNLNPREHPAKSKINFIKVSLSIKMDFSLEQFALFSDVVGPV